MERRFGPFRPELRFRLQQSAWRANAAGPTFVAHPLEHFAYVALLISSKQQAHDRNFCELECVLQWCPPERVFRGEDAVLLIGVANLSKELPAALRSR